MDNIGKHLASVVGGLETKRGGGNVRPAWDEHLSLSEAIDAVQRIVGYYPHGGKDAGDSYIGAMAAVLADYPKAIADKCADARRGIVLSAKFLPAVAEVVVWCEKEAGRLTGGPRPYPVFPPAETVSRDGRLSYEELKDKYGDGEGGWGIGATRRKIYPPPRQIMKEEIEPSPYLIEAILRKNADEPVDNYSAGF